MANELDEQDVSLINDEGNDVHVINKKDAPKTGAGSVVSALPCPAVVSVGVCAAVAAADEDTGAGSGPFLLHEGITIMPAASKAAEILLYDLFIRLPH